MTQIVSLVKDGRVQYAMVDEEGHLVEFAQILVPDHFDLHASATLGTNLIDAIGLNGRAKSKSKARQALPPADQPSLLDEPVALAPGPLPAAKGKTARGSDRKHRYPSGRAKPDPANKVERYISGDEVLAVLAHFPEGASARELSEHIWLTVDGKGTDKPMPRWVSRSVENRLSAYRMTAEAKGQELPFRVSYQPMHSADGTLLKQQRKLYHPREESSG